MKKLDLATVPKNLKPNPIFKGLPENLKDPACFEGIEKKLMELIKSDHKHKTASSYVKCKECQAKYQVRKKEMRKMGFKSVVQYLEWKKIMTIIRDKKSFQLK